MTACDPLELEILPPYIGSAVSPTVDITETTDDITVTITDFRGEHAYTVDKTDQAIADAEQAATNANNAATQATATANAAAQYARTTADQAAADAQATADAAAGRADTAAGGANQAAQAATTAAGTANTAAQNADAKAALADSKAALANTATTAATNAAQAANNAADVAIEAAETITDGYFPHMLAGAAESLMGDTDAATFAERVSTHDGVARIESILGNTVVWNQLCDFAKATHGMGFTNETDDGATHTISAEYSTSSNAWIGIMDNIAVASNHKYLLVCDAAATKAGLKATLDVYQASMSTSFIDSANRIKTLAAANSYKKLYALFAITAVGTGGFYTRVFFETGTASPEAGDTCRVRNLRMFDLTQMFGAGNEPATAAEFEAMFPDDYYAYDAGSLLSVNIEGVNDREIPAATYFPDGMDGMPYFHDELTASKAIKRVRRATIARHGTVHTGGNIKYAPIDGVNADSWASAGDVPTNYGFTVNPVTGVSTGSMGSSRLAIGRTWNSIYAYAPADSDDSIFDQLVGTEVVFLLANPVETPIDPPLNMTYRVEQGGTEQIIIPSGENSAAPTMAIVYGLTADGVVDKALSVIAPIEGATASTNYSVNAYLVHDQQLYRVTSAISTGEAITPGSNCVACTVMGEIVRLTA